MNPLKSIIVLYTEKTKGKQAGRRYTEKKEAGKIFYEEEYFDEVHQRCRICGKYTIKSRGICCTSPKKRIYLKDFIRLIGMWDIDMIGGDDI